MNIKCLIGYHTYKSISKIGKNEYIKKCNVCGHIKHLNIEKLEIEFRDKYREINVLYDISRHFEKCHNNFDAIKTINKTLLLQPLLKKQYGVYENFYQLEDLFKEIEDYKNQIKRT